MKSIAICGDTYSQNLGDGIIADCLSHMDRRVDTTIEIRLVDLSGRKGFHIHGSSDSTSVIRSGVAAVRIASRPAARGWDGRHARGHPATWWNRSPGAALPTTVEHRLGAALAAGVNQNKLNAVKADSLDSLRALLASVGVVG